MKRQCILLVLVACSSFQSFGQPPDPDGAAGKRSLQAGPVYTSAEKSGGGSEAGKLPEFPELQILLNPSEDAQTASAKDFHLAVDGKDCGNASQIEKFGSSGYGLAAAVTIDVSGSMNGGPLHAIRAGLLKFADQAGDWDKVAIETVADDSRWDAAWEAPRPQLRTALQHLASRGKLTRLWDGVFTALESFPEEPRARRLIVISDGHDEGSKQTEAAAIASAKNHHIVIDTIGVTRTNRTFLKSLQMMAVQTGGLFRAAANEQQLEQLVGSGISHYKSLPLATFTTKGIEGDGKDHELTVSWNVQTQAVQAEISTALPLITNRFGPKQWMWIGAGAALSLLLGGALLRRRPVKGGSSAERSLAANAAPATVYAPGPPTVFAGSRPKPFVGAAAVLGAAAASAGSNAAPSIPHRTVGTPSPAFAKAETLVAYRFPDPSPANATAWLWCEAGPAMHKEFPIVVPEFWIGGLSNNDLPIGEDPTLSGNHACIVFDHGALGVFDHDSTNGTWVNDGRVQGTRRLLQPGDRLRVGSSTFVVQATPMRSA